MAPPPKKPKRDPADWMTRSQIGRLLGISPRQFDDRVRPQMPVDCIKGVGAKLRIYAPAAVQARVEQKIAETAEAVSPSDPLMAGPGSAALERYRLARAKREELELEVRRGNLVQLEELRQGWSIVAAQLRQAAEGLQRTFGEEAASIVRGAMAEAMTSVEELTEPRAPVADTARRG